LETIAALSWLMICPRGILASFAPAILLTYGVEWLVKRCSRNIAVLSPKHKVPAAPNVQNILVSKAHKLSLIGWGAAAVILNSDVVRMYLRVVAIVQCQANSPQLKWLENPQREASSSQKPECSWDAIQKTLTSCSFACFARFRLPLQPS